MTIGATVILNPKAAADIVCHEEQVRIWADEMIAAIGMQGDFLKELSYDELLDFGRIVECEIKNIIQSAFDHPEAATIRRRR